MRYVKNSSLFIRISLGASLALAAAGCSNGTPNFDSGASTVGTGSGTPVPGHSSITGTGPVLANGTAVSTITITLQDSFSAGVAGVTPAFSATDTGSTNVYGACSTTNASGVSTCTLKSSTAETKTLSITSPISLSGGTVTFTTQSASVANSTITGSGPVIANGVSTSTVTITLKDASNVAMAGITPSFSATDTGSTNAYGACSATNASGVSTCTLKSSTAETKTLSITGPINKSGGTVVFTAPAVSSTNSSITGTTPVLANGASASTITITLKDADNVAMAGVTPTFSATNTGSTNAYGACSATNASGVSTCTLKSSTAETKTLSLATPASFSGGTVVFTTPTASTTNSSITGTGPVVANGVKTSTVTITLKDADNVAMAGVTPTFSATDTGTTNVYGACSATNASGVSTCTLKSSTAETKTLSIATPISMSGGTVVFTAPTLAISPTSVTIDLIEKTKFTGSGGTPAYTWSVTAGTGSVASGIYTAAGSATTATVKLLDTDGTFVNATVNVKDWTVLENYQLNATTQSLPYSCDINTTGAVLFATGEAQDAGGVRHWLVRSSSNSGSTWAVSDNYQLNSGSDSVAMSVAASSATTIYVVGYGTDAGGKLNWVVRKSTNTGSTWSTVDTFQYAANQNSQANNMAVDASGNLYVSGYGTDNTGKRHWIVRKSTNAGTSWTTVDDYQLASGFAAEGRAIGFDASSNLFVTGYGMDSSSIDHWIVRKSTNSGSTWSTVDNYNLAASQHAEASTYRSFLKDSSGNLYVSGRARDSSSIRHWIVRKSTDNGATWSTVDNYQYATTTDSEGQTITTDTLGNVYAMGIGRDAGGVRHWVIRKSYDAGSTWNGIEDYQAVAGQSAIAYDMFWDSAGTRYTCGASRDASSVYHWYVKKL